ncbi:MAG: hypothetical protein QXP68_02385 [Thermosphaera sp.]
MVSLVLISVNDGDQLRKAEDLINNFKNEIFVTDMQTLQLLVNKKLLTKGFAGKLYVFNSSFPEEDSLKLFALSKPDDVVVCDEAGRLEAFTRFVKRVSGLRILEC